MIVISKSDTARTVFHLQAGCRQLCVQIISTCGAASWAPRLVGVKQRPALQLARPVPGLVTDRRAVDNGREKRAQAAEDRQPVFLWWTRFDGVSTCSGQEQPNVLDAAAARPITALTRDIVFHQAIPR